MKILPQTSAHLFLLVLQAASVALVVFVLCPAWAHAQGGVPVWTNHYNGPGNNDDGARAVTVDRSNNVVEYHDITPPLGQAFYRIVQP